MPSWEQKPSNVVSQLYLQGWFWANVVITLYSKAVFSVYKFPYPLLMTAVHMAFTSAGVWIAGASGMYEPKPLTTEAWRQMLWFSVVFSVNIWMSNASLMAVSVNLHQVVRTTIPLFTMWMSAAFFKTKYSLRLIPSIIVIMAGVACTVRGELEFAWAPFALVVFGSLVSALKGIVTQQTQVGSLGLNALDMLRAVAPLATVQLLLLSVCFGETSALYSSRNMSWPLFGHLVLNGLIAFFLNFVSFRTAALVSPLTMNVAGNVKQVLTCVLSVFMFGGKFNIALVTGIVSTSLGAFWYAQEMKALKSTNKQAKEKNQDKNNSSGLPLPVTRKDTDEHHGKDIELAESPTANTHTHLLGEKTSGTSAQTAAGAMRAPPAVGADEAAGKRVE